MKVFGIIQNGLYLQEIRANEKYRSTRAIQSTAQEYCEFTPYFSKEPRFFDRISVRDCFIHCIEAIRFKNMPTTDIIIKIEEEN